MLCVPTTMNYATVYSIWHFGVKEEETGGGDDLL